ncbi:F-box protein At2g32560-like isoform X2 [Miscanthus floridulus]|uniref:F-box protein At2g32560-like isoform X2 n=1 Tax=Miscanthus floridulus TaxID=154761 RepID=UPI003457A4DE
MLALLAAFAVACLLFLSRPCACDMRLFLASLCRQLLLSLLGFLAGLRLLGGVAAASAATETMPLMPSFKRKRAAATVENAEDAAAAGGGCGEPSVLDLPELAIDCILERLQPAELRSMAAVCRSMRERCRGDHLWERHMTSKWGRVLGRAARDEWRTHLASVSESSAAGSVSGGGGGKRRRWLATLSCVCPVVSWMRSKADGGKSSAPVLDDSIMWWYLSMESGKFWFPAQVYNREHGHVGFMMSCYDAELSYDFHTDTFRARYLPHGRRTVVLEDGVHWDRVRAPPVDTLAHDLHTSDCLHELRPGDHIEIQWRRNKEFPYVLQGKKQRKETGEEGKKQRKRREAEEEEGSRAAEETREEAGSIRGGRVYDQRRRASRCGRAGAAGAVRMDPWWTRAARRRCRGGLAGGARGRWTRARSGKPPPLPLPPRSRAAAAAASFPLLSP